MNKIKTFIQSPKIPLAVKLAVKTLCLFFVLRLLFLAINSNNLHGPSLEALFQPFTFGLRLDLIPTFYLTLLVIALIQLKKNKPITYFLSFLIAAVVFLSLIDAYYFSYLKERMGHEIFWQLDTSNNISLFTYMADYWLGALIGLVIVTLFHLWVKGDIIKHKPTSTTRIWNLVTLVLLFFVARGGLRSKPIRSADVGQYVETQYAPLAINTGLYVFESWRNPIGKPNFIQHLTPQLTPTSFASDSIYKYNIVVVILESFGKEYTGLNGNMAVNYTPFLNQLIDSSVCFTQAYANGLKSVDAVPAIFSGIPRISSSSFIHSPQSSTPLPSLLSTLKPLGYYNSFFHGADNHSMGFQSFLRNQGLEHYFGVDEYPNPKDHDGHWGIFDGPYLQYVANQLSRQPQPFVSGVFTLSSHHPYPIPPDYTRLYPKGNPPDGFLPIHESVGYTDYALQKFMETCRKQDWFNNTIFVITADHSAQNQLHAYRTSSGKYAIPLLLYAPKILTPRKFNHSVAQIDIFPTVLDLINYPTPITLLGQSMYNSKDHAITHFDNQRYSHTQGHWTILANSNQVTELYNTRHDINCLNNLKSTNTSIADSLRIQMNLNLVNYFEWIGSSPLTN